MVKPMPRADHQLTQVYSDIEWLKQSNIALTKDIDFSVLDNDSINDTNNNNNNNNSNNDEVLRFKFIMFGGLIPVKPDETELKEYNESNVSQNENGLVPPSKVKRELNGNTKMNGNNNNNESKLMDDDKDVNDDDDDDDSDDDDESGDDSDTDDYNDNNDYNDAWTDDEKIDTNKLNKIELNADLYSLTYYQ